jgi:hypothetical protein
VVARTIETSGSAGVLASVPRSASSGVFHFDAGLLRSLGEFERTGLLDAAAAGPTVTCGKPCVGHNARRHTRRHTVAAAIE